MRSRRALVAAAVILLSYPVALATQFLFGRGADTVIHFVTGLGFLVFASSVFDFALPRWVNIVGAIAAAGFGTIFVLQGLSDVTQVEGLRHLAFDVLGRHVERLLPDVVYLWFLALLVLDSRGRSRVLGWIVMVVVIATEIASVASLLFGFPLPNLKIAVLLPFVWLVSESVERRTGTGAGRTADRAPQTSS